MNQAASQPGGGAAGRYRGLWRAAFVAAVVVYAASGTYVVQPEERGVVRVFGRLVSGEVGPGVHYAPPWPIGRVDRPKTTEVRRVSVGFDAGQRERIERGDLDAISGSPQSDVLSGDTNILKVSLVVQYTVVDPVRYVLCCVDPDELVRLAAESVVAGSLARLPVDEVLTVARVELRDAVMARVGERLGRYETGISIVSAAVQSVEPPIAVSAAFKDVTSAEYDRARLIERARNDAEVSLRSARGQAFERLQAARDFETQRVSRARGEAGAFLAQVHEYKKVPGVTRQRMLLSTLERVLPNTRVVVVDEQEGRAPVELRFFEVEPPAGLK